MAHGRTAVLNPTSPTGRRHGLDWLRVLAFCLLVPLHTGMFFVPADRQTAAPAG